jgi:aminomethyltransferase
VEILNSDNEVIGQVTSGAFAPSLGEPVAMGYVETEYSGNGTDVSLLVRGSAMAAKVVSLPFWPHRYFKAGVNQRNF